MSDINQSKNGSEIPDTKNIIKYNCDDCSANYTRKWTYERHIITGACAKKAKKNKLLINIKGNNNTVIQTQNIVTNNIYINVQNEFTDWLQSARDEPGLKLLSNKEQQQVAEVLEMLHKSGYTTRSDVEKLMMEEFKTVQQMEIQINEFPKANLRNIIEDYSPANISTKPTTLNIRKTNNNNVEPVYNMEEHSSFCILALFKSIIGADDPSITPEILKSNPLFRTSTGKLSAWFSDIYEPKFIFSKFPETKGVCREWRTMQEHMTWMNLVDTIISCFQTAIRDAKKTSPHTVTPYETELLEYWDYAYRSSLVKKPAVFKEMAKILADICSQEDTCGWHHLSKLISKSKYKQHEQELLSSQSPAAAQIVEGD